jgi:hypothetical protein
MFAGLADAGVSTFRAAQATYSRVLCKTLPAHLDGDELETLTRLTGKLLAGLTAEPVADAAKGNTGRG